MLVHSMRDQLSPCPSLSLEYGFLLDKDEGSRNTNGNTYEVDDIGHLEWLNVHTVRTMELRRPITILP